MNLAGIISMIICLGLVLGGFLYFLRKAIKHEKSIKDHGEN